jgi:thioredoxin 1
MKEDSKCAQLNNEQDLASTLKKNNKVIALFYASWCPFCARFLPIFKKQAEGKEQNFLLVQDDEETIGDKYSVRIFPTVLFFEQGVLSKRLDGAAGAGLQEKQLVEFIRETLIPKASPADAGRSVSELIS